MTNTDSPLDELIADINADWWNDGQTSYEDGKAEQERTKQAISLYCHKQVIEARLQATLNTAERIKVSFLEHRARTPVQEWKTLEEIIEREKFNILAELKLKGEKE